MPGGDAVRLPTAQAHPIGINRVQDEAMMGYVFQRPTEQDFNIQTSAFQAKQTPRTWALADDGLIDNVSCTSFEINLLMVFVFTNFDGNG